MSNPVVNWAQENPLIAGVAAIGVVVVVMALMGGSGGGSSDNGGAVAAYYAAVGQQTQAGNAVQIAQIQANAGTNQALIAATYGLDTTKVLAGVQTNKDNLDYTYNQEQGNRAFWIAQHTIESNERLGANTNAANVQIAQAQAKGQAQVAKAQAQGSGNTAGGIISAIGGAASGLSKLFSVF